MTPWAQVVLDLPPGSPADDFWAATDRLAGLGATVVRVTDDWTTLTSPGGLDFRLVAHRDRQRPAPIHWPDGTRSRLIQLCIDAPPRGD